MIFKTMECSNMKKYLLALTILYHAPFVSADVKSDEDKGLAIAIERKARDTGWHDFRAQSTMILRSTGGEESVRKLSVKVLEVLGDGDKSINVFSEPKDIKGTALLSISHISKDDDQWLFLPSLKRTKRIASSNKSGPFMGSEFSYEDLSSYEVEKYTYRFIRSEACGEQQCFVLESTPKDKYSGYSKRISWIGHDHYRVHKTEFYDRRGDLLKTLELDQYKLYLSKYWRPHRLKMVNHQSGKSTDLLNTEVSFSNGYTDKDFTKNVLARIR